MQQQHIPIRVKRSKILRGSLLGLILLATTLCSPWALRPRVATAQGTGAGRLLIAAYGNSIYALNADPVNGSGLYDVVSHYPSNAAPMFPSVSPANGKIAFLYVNNYVGRIWIMDADGSHPRQLTQGGDAAIVDSNPIISPDGTKVAFRSNRFAAPTFNDGQHKLPEVFTVNIDGSNLQQVTPSQQEPFYGSNPNTFVDDFGWSGTSLFVVGARVVPGQERLQYGIFRYNQDGTGQTTVKITGGTGYFNAQAFDVSRDGTKLAYANDTRIFIFDAASGNQTGQLDGNTPGADVALQGRGGVRFSLDGTRLLYHTNGGQLRTIGLNGANPLTVSNDGGYGTGLWWYEAPPIPPVARVELAPPVVVVPADGSTRQLTPTIYDANNNVMFHAGQLGVFCDATHPCDINANPYGAFQFTHFGNISVSNPSNPPTGYVTVCAVLGFGGRSGCNIAAINRSVTLAEVRASVANANTNGSGGPGVFTLRRSSTDPNAPVNINFTLGGTAVRGTDYTLDVVGNSVVIPAGQTTFDIKVTPLRAAGNKTVTLAVTAPQGANYITVTGTDTATVNITDNGGAPSLLSLSTVTPNIGGNGGAVGVRVYGANIRPGATVKLARSGQNDVAGATPVIAADGAALNATFDLQGKAVGAWDVVVTNADTTTARLTNGFTVQENSPANLSVYISGPDEIRASHVLANFDVVYSNGGNVDAYGVILSVSGIIPPECHGEPDCQGTTFETDMADIPDVPGQPPFPAVVRQAPRIVPINRQVYPGGPVAGAFSVLIPRIPAQSNGVFRFKMRFNAIVEGGFLDLRAALHPPLLKAVSSQGPTLGLTLVPNTPPIDLTDDEDTALYCFLHGYFDVAVQRVLGSVVLDCLNNARATYTMVVAESVRESSGSFVGETYNAMQLASAAYNAYSSCFNGTGANLTSAFSIASFLAQGDDEAEACYSYFSRKRARAVTSFDPNEKAGPAGNSPQNYVAHGNLHYGVSFENLPTASAPAQDVVVTDQLDTSRLDLSTFALGPISFGDSFVNVPPGLKSYTTEVDLRPANNLLVRLTANLNPATGLVTWEFHSLDPFTRLPPSDATAGFLPPDLNGTQGRGKVLFTVAPQAALAAGTEIRNRARIAFDLNAPLDTNEWLNTLDDSKPVSSVQPLAANQQFIIFDVNWAGTDTGSGVKDYTLYVSANGGPFAPAAVYTTATTKLFVGQPDTTYAFYTLARDQAGNVENGKTAPEATTHTPASVLNAVDDARYFVRQHYLDFLAREPDRPGLDYWTGQLTSCETDANCLNARRIGVSAAYFIELEFQQTGSVVYRFYRAAYGTQAAPNQTRADITFAQFIADRARLVGGLQLEQSTIDFANAFVQREEFLARYPATLSNGQYVNQLFDTASLTPFTAEREAEIEAMNTGGRTRAQVLRNVINLGALQAREYNPSFVLMQYYGYLRRDPDQGGYDFWLGVLNQQPGNYRGMVCAFITSAEYQLRFGVTVTRDNQLCAGNP